MFQPDGLSVQKEAYCAIPGLTRGASTSYPLSRGTWILLLGFNINSLLQSKHIQGALEFGLETRAQLDVRYTSLPMRRTVEITRTMQQYHFDQIVTVIAISFPKVSECKGGYDATFSTTRPTCSCVQRRHPCLLSSRYLMESVGIPNPLGAFS